MNALNRRDVVEAGAALVAGLGLLELAELAEASAPPRPRVWAVPPKDELTHLLGRVTCGFTAADHEQAGARGYEGYLEWQLDHLAVDDHGVEAYLQAVLPTLTMSLNQLLVLAADQATRQQAFNELLVATFYRQVNTPRQLFEVMVEFWSDHFSVNGVDGILSTFKPFEDREVMRRHALGTFRELLRADAKSPAMLYYLDNASNTKDGPNENYARELLELHTLGVDGGYGEEDVRAAARVFTGWGFDRATAFRFYPERHDYGAKTVLGASYAAGRGLDCRTGA